MGCLPRSAFLYLTSLVARRKVMGYYVTWVSSSLRTSLGSNLGFNFLSVFLVWYDLSNFSPSGSYKIIFMCHDPSPALGGLSHFHLHFSPSLFHLFISMLIGITHKNSIIFLKTRGSSKGSSSSSLAMSCSTECVLSMKSFSR
jgi:hypothetical protein